MFHPSILAQYLYRRSDLEAGALDACTDTADYYDLPVYRLARFLVTMGIDANRLSLLA